jgi:hypothetical protein
MTQKQSMLVATWNNLENDDPDISTESLFARVCSIHTVTVDEVAAALYADKVAKGEVGTKLGIVRGGPNIQQLPKP